MEAFLKKTECHFNWNLSAIDVSDLNWAEKFRDKIEENQSLGDPSELIWPLKLTYAFELFPINKDESAKVVDNVVKDIEEAKDGLTSKYMISYVHIAYSFKAFALVKSQGYTENVVKLTKKIKPLAEMTQVEKSAVLAMQAQVLSYYGPNGVYKCVPLQREAIRLNPEEIEFKLSLVVSMNRKRHYDISNIQSQMTWSNIEEPVNILAQLLNQPALTPNQRVSCEYFLAVAYADFLKTLKPFHEEYKECKHQILKSCDWIHDKSDHPQIMSFCADNFFILEKNRPKALRTMEAALKKYPHHVGVNTKISKFYDWMNNFNLAAKHAQIALDGGGYGAAWILLKVKVKLEEEFDDVEYFDKLVLFFPQRYKKQTHLFACLYYMQSKYDVVKGAHHMEMVLAEDPSYASLKSCYSNWINRIINPLEMAYNKIVEALKTAGYSREDLSTLRRAKNKIEELADVNSFDLTSQTGASGIVTGNQTVGSRTILPDSRGSAHRGVVGIDRKTPVDRPSTSNSKSSTSREDASKFKNESFSQWMNKADSNNHPFRTEGDLNRRQTALIERGSATNSKGATSRASNGREDASKSKDGGFSQWMNKADSNNPPSSFRTEGDLNRRSTAFNERGSAANSTSGANSNKDVLHSSKSIIGQKTKRGASTSTSNIRGKASDHSRALFGTKWNDSHR